MRDLLANILIEGKDPEDIAKLFAQSKLNKTCTYAEWDLLELLEELTGFMWLHNGGSDEFWYTADVKNDPDWVNIIDVVINGDPLEYDEITENTRKKILEIFKK